LSFTVFTDHVQTHAPRKGVLLKEQTILRFVNNGNECSYKHSSFPLEKDFKSLCILVFTDRVQTHADRVQTHAPRKGA